MLSTALREGRRKLWHLRDNFQRSGSWQTWRQMNGGLPLEMVQLKIRIHGSVVDVVVRGGTEDETMLRKILRHDEPEYPMPRIRGFYPHTIFDMGANIGLASIYFATMFPNAQIWAFEPLPANVDLLRMNVKQFGGRVRVMPYGLGDRSGQQSMFLSDDLRNFGGGSFVSEGRDLEKFTRTTQLPIRTLAEVFRSESLPQPDMIKLDVEGYELPILRGCPPHLVEDTRLLLGELHGKDDLKILNELSKTHQIGYRKNWNDKYSHFEAVSLELGGAK